MTVSSGRWMRGGSSSWASQGSPDCSIGWAPPALVRSGIDLTGAQELLLGYELDHGVPAHKFYVVGLTPECHTDLCRALEVGTSTPGPPTFFSVKWHTGGAHRWWTAEYRMPPAGLTPVRAVEDSFDLPEHWRWMRVAPAGRSDRVAPYG